MKTKFKSLLALLLILCIMLSVSACGADSSKDNDKNNNTFDKFIEYPDDVEIDLIPSDLMHKYSVYTIEFPTYEDFYKFTSRMHYDKPHTQYLGEGFETLFDREEYKAFADNLIIPIQKNDYPILIRYRWNALEQCIWVNFNSLNDNSSMSIFVYEKNEKTLSDMMKRMEEYSGNRQEKITLGNYEIPMYFGFYATNTQKNMWYGYCVTSDFIIWVSISSDGTKDVAAGLEMAKDFEFIPLTEYPNLEK